MSCLLSLRTPQTLLHHGLKVSMNVHSRIWSRTEQTWHPEDQDLPWPAAVYIPAILAVSLASNTLKLRPSIRVTVSASLFPLFSDVCNLPYSTTTYDAQQLNEWMLLAVTCYKLIITTVLNHYKEHHYTSYFWSAAVRVTVHKKEMRPICNGCCCRCSLQQRKETQCSHKT